MPLLAVLDELFRVEGEETRARDADCACIIDVCREEVLQAIRTPAECYVG